MGHVQPLVVAALLLMELTLSSAMPVPVSYCDVAEGPQLVLQHLKDNGWRFVSIVRHGLAAQYSNPDYGDAPMYVRDHDRRVPYDLWHLVHGNGIRAMIAVRQAGRVRTRIGIRFADSEVGSGNEMQRLILLLPASPSYVDAEAIDFFIGPEQPWRGPELSTPAEN